MEMKLSYMMMTTPLPYLDTKGGGTQNGISCIGCQIAFVEATLIQRTEGRVTPQRNRVYTHEKFMEHFQRCPQAQSLWRLSEEGTLPNRVQDFVIRKGYLNDRYVAVYSMDNRARYAEVLNLSIRPDSLVTLSARGIYADSNR
jgi:hypothetical protein